VFRALLEDLLDAVVAAGLVGEFQHVEFDPFLDEVLLVVGPLGDLLLDDS